MSSIQRLASLPVHPLPDGLPEPAAWRLRVDGLAGRPLGLTVEQIIALAPAQRIEDFACSEGWVVPELRWEGVPVATVLDLAAPPAAARWLRCGAGDFSVSMPLDEARAGALLAYRLDSAPLAAEHGAPLRLIAPGRACFYSVKWIDHLELLAEDVATTGEAIARARIARALNEEPRSGG